MRDGSERCNRVERRYLPGLNDGCGPCLHHTEASSLAWLYSDVARTERERERRGEALQTNSKTWKARERDNET